MDKYIKKKIFLELNNHTNTYILQEICPTILLNAITRDNPIWGLRVSYANVFYDPARHGELCVIITADVDLYEEHIQGKP